MTAIIISLIINAFVLLGFIFSGSGETIRVIFGMVLLVFWVCSAAGSFLYMRKKKKAYGILAMLGFALFFPIGLIGVLGLKSIMDKIVEVQSSQNIKGPVTLQDAQKIDAGKAEHEFLYNKIHTNVFIVFAIVCAGLTLLMFLSSNHFPGWIFSLMIVNLVLYFIYKKYVVLRIYEDSFLVQLGPSAQKKLYYFKDVARLLFDKNIIMTLVDGKELKVGLNAFDADKREHIKTVLSQKIAEHMQRNNKKIEDKAQRKTGNNKKAPREKKQKGSANRQKVKR